MNLATGCVMMICIGTGEGGRGKDTGIETTGGGEGEITDVEGTEEIVVAIATEDMTEDVTGTEAMTEVLAIADLAAGGKKG